MTSALIQNVQSLVRASDIELEPRERLTLQIGSCIVLSTLGLGLQVGHWSSWSALGAAASYLVWVMLYSEATVQVGRRRVSSGR